MSAADSARLELAKRAYRATEPSELEVQTGVRRARLALRRSKPRRKWLMKGLVFVVLALGSLAYAKPHTFADLVERGLPALRGDGRQQRAALTNPREAPPTPTPDVAPALAEPSKTTPVAAASLAAPAPRPAEPPPRRGAAKVRTSVVAQNSAFAPTSSSSSPPISASSEAPAAPRPAESVSEWGRVGQALARGDEAGALSALGKLSESDDARTRDKADLGRAQLLMSHGNRDQACSLARSLTRRRAGGHIERQALMLIKDCGR